MSTATPEERAVVEGAIPHRPPFLFVDRVLDHTVGSLTSEWRVPEDAAWFRGHFPGRPVLPGVLISEHVFQTGALLISFALGGFKSEDGLPVLTRVENARFRRMVLPGETLTTKVSLRERLGPAWYLDGRVQCGSQRVLQIGCVLSASEALARATS